MLAFCGGSIAIYHTKYLLKRMSLINGTSKQWCQHAKNIICKLSQMVSGESTVKCFYALLSLKTMIPVYLDHVKEFRRGISAGNKYILEMLLLFLLLLMLFSKTDSIHFACNS